jgi:hypothetical protein
VWIVLIWAREVCDDLSDCACFEVVCDAAGNCAIMPDDEVDALGQELDGYVTHLRRDLANERALYRQQYAAAKINVHGAHVRYGLTRHKISDREPGKA